MRHITSTAMESVSPHVIQKRCESSAGTLPLLLRGLLRQDHHAEAELIDLVAEGAEDAYHTSAA